MALEIAFASLDLDEGDEVILSSFSIISCLNPILRQRLKPVFIDVDSNDWNTTSASILESITNRTRAIICCHTYGLSVDLNPILKVCEERNIYLIEDAAEAHGVKYLNKYCGSLGNIGIFSFYANKFISTGEGGMLVTNSQEMRDKFRLLRNLGFRPDERFVHDIIGWNARMPSLQAALGVSQLTRLDKIVSGKKKLAEIYRDNLSGIEGLRFQVERNPWSENVYWVVGITLSSNLYPNANVIRMKLNKLGVGSRSFFFPLHLQPVSKKYGIAQVKGSYPVAEKLYDEGLYLPSGLKIQTSDVDEICSRLLSILRS
jgi:perosamine synthetase